SQTVAGPIYLVLDSLSANTSLTNKTGTTANNPPASPYITVQTGSLAPGAATSVVLQFAAPTSGGITYSARTLSATANPQTGPHPHQKVTAGNFPSPPNQKPGRQPSRGCRPILFLASRRDAGKLAGGNTAGSRHPQGMRPARGARSFWIAPLPRPS